MIKPEQIPDEVESAMEWMISRGEDWKSSLAAAINSWPGRFSGNAWSDLAPTIVLPLSHENNDD